jgi:hypothetical protein
MGIAFTVLVYAQETVVFHEGFESGVKPADWTQKKVVGEGGEPTGATVDWQYTDGGYFDYPINAFQGNYNAMFQKESYDGEATILITPPLDLSEVLKPELRFAHTQQTWYVTLPNDDILEYNDKLNVYYKRGLDSSWVLLKAYEEGIESWQLRSILLPDSSLSSTYYIGFEGITGYGYGTCIDTVHIMETGIISKFVDSYSIQQTATDFIPTNTTNNPILKIIIDVQGNDGNLYLDSLKVSSLNTDDSNIAPNGVKLYATADSTFKDPILIKGGVDFIDGDAWFKDINYDLPRGISTIWITYDIAAAVDHDIHNNIVDAKMEAESIFINGYAYPFADKSPEGERLLKEAIFNDTFEDDLGWVLHGSFQRATPLGLGTSFPGNPDPENAYNGIKILGTDLTSDGAYANNLTDRSDSAVSPSFDCFYYKDVTLYFVRWLNIEFFDNCYLDLSDDAGTSWNQAWKNPGSIIEDSWSTITYDLDNADFKSNVKLRFGLGTTSAGNQFTGWNIDDFILVGDFISKDVGISEIVMPETDCGHTTSDDITVSIKNYAGEETPSTIPVRYKIDDNETYVTDAHTSSIAVGGSTSFTFSVGADLSTPGYHTIYVETALSGDEISSNNLLSKTIFSYPTYTLPYLDDFETNNGYYLPGGVNSTWGHGEPTASVIHDAASGTNAWVTNLLSSYLNNDSSFIESPCFDFTDNYNVIFEFKAIGISEDKTDGLTLMYTTDGGVTWDVAPDNDDYYWNWYNETNISELGLPGLDTTDGVWKTFRQLLPDAVNNESNVKFRFLFESNESVRNEGFGIDDVKIYEAPSDVGVSSIFKPESACEIGTDTTIQVYIENYGIDTIHIGERIPMVLDFNTEIIKDTFEIATTFDPGTNQLFTFTSPVNMGFAGEYDFKVYTKFERDQYFYNETVSNDSLYDTLYVYGMPNYNPFNDLMGDESPIDTFLVAGTGYTNYNWTGGGIPDTPPSDTLYVDTEAWYYVTVTNDSSCTAVDSVEVVESVIDLTVDKIYTILKDSCSRNDSTILSIRFTNNNINATPLGIGDTILLGYQINDNEIVPDTLFVGTAVPVGDTAVFVYNQKANFKDPDEYNVKLFTSILKDLNHVDDTTYATFNTWGYPNVELEFDTIYSSEADTITLDAGSDFAGYSWSSGQGTQTITPTNVTTEYIVTVTSAHCGDDSDTTYIETYDLGVTEGISPVNSCESVALETASLTIDVANYSDNVYTDAEPMSIFYKLDENAWTETNPTLTGGLAATDTTTLTIASINVRAIGEHTLKVYTSSNRDANHENDTLEYTFNTWPNPEVNLAYDTIYTTKADTVVLIADEGYLSYQWNDTHSTTNDSLLVETLHSVKYKVTVTDEHCGTAKDSTQILAYDLGVLEMVAPLSACEHPANQQVIIKIINFGKDTIKTGEIIPVSYTLEGGPTYNENITITENLLPSKTLIYTFNNTVDLSGSGTYKFYMSTRFNYDVKTSNDTLIDAIKTFGYPTVEIGSDIYTAQADTVIIVADPGYSGYIWNEGTKNDTLEISSFNTTVYEVIVTDINGCSTSDSLKVYTYDVIADSLSSPITKCELTASETISIGVTNNGADTLLITEPVEVGYKLNSGTYASETFTLSKDLAPDSTEVFTLSGDVDLSAFQAHEFKLFAKLTNVDVETNDTTTKTVNYLRPIFDLGDPQESNVDDYEIDAGAGFESYDWFDGITTTQTYTVNVNEQNPNYYYAVTVTNSGGCEASDSLMLTFTILPDLSITQFDEPIDECWVDGKKHAVKIEVSNIGGVNLNTNTKFTLGYTIDDGTPETDTITLTSPFNASTSFDYEFEDSITFPSGKIYEFKPFVKFGSDGNETNDTLTSNNTVDISAPVVDFGADTVTFTDQYTIVISGNFDSYVWSTDETTSTITITETGDYSVTVTDNLGCQGSGTLHCKKPTGIDDFIHGNGYSISYYPNPASDELRIDISNSEPKDLVLEIINIQGQVLHNKEYKNSLNTIERIDVSPYSKGVYYIRFKIDDKFYIRKLIIQ